MKERIRKKKKLIESSKDLALDKISEEECDEKSEKENLKAVNKVNGSP